MAQQNGFGLPFFSHDVEDGKRHSKDNKYDLTNVPWFLLVNHNDRSRLFVISSVPPICSPNFSFMSGVQKK